MPKRVDHDRRRSRILLRALSVFQEKGFADTSLADVAIRAKVSRPTLYQYFSDKDELFHDAIKFATDLMLMHFFRIAEDDKRPVRDRLLSILETMTDSFFKNQKLLQALFNFLIDLRGTGEVFNRFVSRRTIQMKRLFVRLAIEGMRSGEFIEASPGAVVNILIAFSQSVFIQIGTSSISSTIPLKRVASAYVESLVKSK